MDKQIKKKKQEPKVLTSKEYLDRRMESQINILHVPVAVYKVDLKRAYNEGEKNERLRLKPLIETAELAKVTILNLPSQAFPRPAYQKLSAVLRNLNP